MVSLINARDRTIASFLLNIVPFRIQYLDHSTTHTVREILGDCWEQMDSGEHPDVVRVFSLLVANGDLPCTHCGCTAAGEPLFKVPHLRLKFF